MKLDILKPGGGANRGVKFAEISVHHTDTPQVGDEIVVETTPGLGLRFRVLERVWRQARLGKGPHELDGLVVEEFESKLGETTQAMAMRASAAIRIAEAHAKKEALKCTNPNCSLPENHKEFLDSPICDDEV